MGWSWFLVSFSEYVFQPVKQMVVNGVSVCFAQGKVAHAAVAAVHFLPVAAVEVMPGRQGFAFRAQEEVVQAAAKKKALELRRYLEYLSVIVTMAPLLGLLGTISGMIESFSIFSVRAGEPLAITGGIGEALIATATGLCVAIFSLIVHTYFVQKLDEMLAMLDKAAAAVRNALKKTGEDGHAA